MDNRQIGEELNQLARFLFNSAANKWYAAIGVEITAGILSAVLNVLDLSGDSALIGAVVVTILLVASYILRLRFDTEYDTAEMMRRQSILTEALDWPVGKVQMSEWRRQAGKKIRDQVRATTRDPNFYSTRKDTGPERLAEVTIESAFFTRHLYIKLRSWIWAIFWVTLAALVLALTIALTRAVPTTLDLVIARVVYSIVPVVLAIDLFGWWLRLGRLTTAIRRIERGLERLRGTSDMDLPQVLRLISEYNCRVVTGIPIHNWLFTRWGDEIRELWQQRF
ncbi:MAG: hypothetical protein ACE5JU_10330 [Candidatus Binatia bacterium]